MTGRAGQTRWALATAFTLAALGTACSSRGTVTVGGACNRDESCATGVCIRESNSPSSVAWTGGYCSGNCADATCPQGLCLTLSDGYSYCLSQCQSDAGCRPGYVCSAGVGACLPDCRLGWSCGPSLICDTATGACTLPTPVPGTTPLGEGCTINMECATGLCIPERSSTGAIAWTGGSCSQSCVGPACPTGAACAVLEDGSAYCVPACAADPDCRAGYVCSAAVGGCLPDCRLGWSCGTALLCDPATGACIPPIPVPGTTPLGGSCALNAECATGLCIPERSGAGTTAWTGGSCSQECVSAACPTGAVCAPMEDGSAYCVPSCASGSDCRPGYTCDADIWGCLPDCRLGWSCGTYLVCDASTGTCVSPPGSDAGVRDGGSRDAAGFGRDDAAGFGRDDAAGFGRDDAAGFGRDDAAGQGPGAGGVWANGTGARP